MGTIKENKLLQPTEGQFGKMSILNYKTLDPAILFIYISLTDMHKYTRIFTTAS